MPHPDKQLAARVLAGEESAFDSFFETYFAALYRFAMLRTRGNEDVAEEVVQATLCLSITKLSTYRGEGSLFSWLCTLCSHEISAHFRRAANQPAVEGGIETLAGGEAAAREWLGQSTVEGPQAALEKKEMSGLVHSTLDSLPSHYGDALEWKYIEGAPVAVIADRLGVSAKAAESLLTRAREAFKESFTSVMDAAAVPEEPAAG